MSEQNQDLWKQAYRKQFGTDPDEDKGEHEDEIEEWRQNWQAGYDKGEEWATTMVQGENAA